MADEEKPNTTETTSQSGTHQGETAKLFTADEVSEIVKDRLRKEFKREAKRAEEKSNPKPEIPKRKDLAQADAKLAETKADKSEVEAVGSDVRRLRFELALSKNGIDVDDNDTVSDLWTLHESQKPTDLKKWIDAKASRFAKPVAAKSESTQTTESVKAEPKQAASAPHAPAVTRPTVPTVNNGLTDIWNMTPSQLEQLGVAGVRAAHEAALAVAHQQQGRPPQPKIPGK